jgi:hypothetical protein
MPSPARLPFALPLTLLFTGMFAICQNALAQIPPANDDFAAATILAVDGTLLGTNVDATEEPGEPDHAGNPGGASVWFEWTAAADGFLSLDTVGSDFDTLLAVYTGSSVDALTQLGSNDDFNGLQSAINNLPVSTGTVYAIAVDGFSAATGQVTLNWSFFDSTDVTPPIVSVTAPTQGAVLFQDSLVLADYHCTDELFGSGLVSCVGDVPDGDAIDTAVLGDFTFTVTGTDGAGNESVVVHDYSVTPGLTNDNFANAELLAVDGSLFATNVGATREPGEPDHAGNVGGASIWFEWTAPSDGHLTVDTYGSNFDTTLALYSGVAIDSLTELASDDDTVTLQSLLDNVFVIGGTTYHIAVDGYFGATGQVTLNWSFADGTDTTPPVVTIDMPIDGSSLIEGAVVLATYACTDEELGSGVASCVGDVPVGEPIDTSTVGPHTFTVTGTDNVGNTTVRAVGYSVDAFTNDDFAEAEVLDTNGDLVRANYNATKEPGEPDHAGNPGGASVWFQWTAPTDGTLTVETFFSDIDTVLAMYTGPSVDLLAEVASDDDGADPWSWIQDVPVVEGTTYWIAVDGVDGATGQIEIGWLFFNGPTFTEVTPAADPLWVTDADHDFWLNAAAPADVDGDGDLDLAVIGYFVEYLVSSEDRLVIFLNEGPDLDGNWIFTTQDVPLGELFAGSSDLAWGDLDGDGDPDLAVGTSGATEIYRNDAGTLVPIPTDLPGYDEDSLYTDAYDLRSLTWADADNDGDLDLLIPSSFDSELFIFTTRLMRNDGPDGAGGWLFSDTGAMLDGTIHAQTAWADDDGDGDLDLFMANVDNFLDDSFVRTYRNDGGTFTRKEPIGSLGIEYGLGDWTDYDQDGDIDILVVGLVEEIDGSFATVLRIYDNDGGIYTPNTIVQSNFFPWLDLHAATWADYDSDGDIDILLTGSVIGENDIEGKSEIYVNDGGDFRPLGRSLPAPMGSVGRGGSFTWFDMDGDGDLDYFVAGSYFVPGGSGLVEAQMHLYRNDAIDPNAAPSAPTGMTASVDGSQVNLSWDPATDDHTLNQALSYDLEVTPVDPVAPGTTYRRLPEPGNISAVTSWVLRGLPEGSYTWSVRAVDSSFTGGPAATGSFTVGEPAPIAGTVNGAQGGIALCRNAGSTQLVRSRLVRGAWDCTAAGLAVEPGDRLKLSLVMRASGTGAIAGTVDGVQVLGGRCIGGGLTAPATINGSAWSCSALPVASGTPVRINLTARAGP